MSLLFNFRAQEAEKLKGKSVACFVGHPVFLHRLFGVGVAGARDYIHVYKGPREEKAPLNQYRDFRGKII